CFRVRPSNDLDEAPSVHRHDTFVSIRAQLPQGIIVWDIRAAAHSGIVSMSYGTLMVHLDVGTSNDRRLRLAGEMAERFKARVIGIAAANIQSTLYFTEGNA